MPIKYLSLNWPKYNGLVEELAFKVLDKKQSIDMIIGISRCGLTLGHLLSDLLQKPIATLPIGSYIGIQISRKPKILGRLSVPIKNKKVLLVDGISDSGNTLSEAIKYLKRQKPKSITTATLFYKPHSIHKPKFFVQETTDWILFPYEKTEWILTFTKNMQQEGKTKEEILDFLAQFGYTKTDISKVYKYFVIS